LGRERLRHLGHLFVDARVVAGRRRVHDAEEPDVLQARRGADEPHGGVDRERGDEDDVSGHRARSLPFTRRRVNVCVSVVGSPAPMRVVFLSPVYPPEMIEYTRGLVEVGAEVYGVGDTPREALPPKVKSLLHDYLRVPRIMD